MTTKKSTTHRHTTNRSIAHRADTATATDQRNEQAFVKAFNDFRTTVHTAAASLKDFSTITEYARQHLPRPRTGASRYLPLLVEVATERTELSSVKDIAPGITSDLAIAAAAEHALVEIDRVRQLLADVVLEHNSHAWTAGLDIYATANAVGRTNTDIKNQIAPVEQFLAHTTHHVTNVVTPVIGTTGTTMTNGFDTTTNHR